MRFTKTLQELLNSSEYNLSKDSIINMGILNAFEQLSFLEQAKKPRPHKIYVEHNKEDMHEVFYRLSDICEDRYILLDHPYIQGINTNKLRELDFIKSYHKVEWLIDNHKTILYVLEQGEEILEVLDLVSLRFNTYDVYDIIQGIHHVETRLNRDIKYTPHFNIILEHKNKHRPVVKNTCICKIMN